jgi:hypothetical protein
MYSPTLLSSFRSLFRSGDYWFDCYQTRTNGGTGKLQALLNQISGSSTTEITAPSTLYEPVLPTPDSEFGGAQTLKTTGAQLLVANGPASEFKFLSDGSGCTVLVVGKFTVADALNQTFIATSGSTSQNVGVYFGKSTGVDNLRIGNGLAGYAVDVQGTPSGATPCYWYLHHKSSPSTDIYGATTGRGTFSPGAYVSAPSAADPASTLSVLARNPATPSNFLTGTFAALFMWRRVLTADERAVAMQYIRSTYYLQPWTHFQMGVCSYNAPDFARAAAIGFKYVRTDNPNATKIAQIRSAGLEVLPIARYGMGDLAGNPSQAQIDAWCAGKIALWSGLATPPPWIECINEPWNTGYSDFTTNYSLYMRILHSFTSQAWAIWPEMPILVCGDTGPINGWLDAVLAADSSKLLADPRIKPSVHNYVEARTPQEDTGGDVFRFKRYEATYTKFLNHGHPNPRIAITEYNWESDTVGSVPQGPTVTEALQAQYLIEGAEIMRRSGKVSHAFVFGMMNATTPAYNLIRPDNGDKAAIAALTRYLRG